MQIDVDKKLQVATKLRMILVSMKHLESYSDIYRHYKIMIIHEAEKKTRWINESLGALSVYPTKKKTIYWSKI